MVKFEPKIFAQVPQHQFWQFNFQSQYTSILKYTAFHCSNYQCLNLMTLRTYIHTLVLVHLDTIE